MSLLDDILEQALHFGFITEISSYNEKENSWDIKFPPYFRPPRKIFVRAEIDNAYYKKYHLNPKEASKEIIHDPPYREGYLSLTMPILEELLATEKIGRPYYRSFNHAAIYGRNEDGSPHIHGHGKIKEKVHVCIRPYITYVFYNDK